MHLSRSSLYALLTLSLTWTGSILGEDFGIHKDLEFASVDGHSLKLDRDLPIALWSRCDDCRSRKTCAVALRAAAA